MDYGTISDELYEQLTRIEPSPVRYAHCMVYPCRVITKSDEVIDRVYMDAFPADWQRPKDIIVPEAFVKPNNWQLHIEDVAKIEENQHRLAPHLAGKLYAAGETGMGYYIYTLVFRNGERHTYLSNGNVDIPPLPEGMTGSDVIDAIPEARSARMENKGDEPYKTCFFRLPATSSR